jgi:PKHD-type hydroxylase
MLKLENVLTREEIARIRVDLARADFYDGTLTGNPDHKKNLQADPRRVPQVKAAAGIVLDAMMRNKQFTEFAWPRKVEFIFNRYDGGMTYRRHADSALMGADQTNAARIDVSATVFLTEPDSYDGGDLVMETPMGEYRFKEKPGTAVVYPTVYVHGVEPVTRGSRVSAILWIQSFIKDSHQRQMAYRFYQLQRELYDTLPNSDLPARYDQILQNLMRDWIEN